VALALGVALVCLLLAGSSSSAQVATRPPLYEPPDGTAYAGMFVRMWDSDDPRIGDTRPFAVRLQDSIDHELGGKPPAIMLVPTIWQWESGAPIPFENTLEEIRRFEAFNGGQIVPFIKWNAQTGWDVARQPYRGITAHDVAQGKLDDYIRQYARDVRAYGRPLFISPVCAEFNGEWPTCSPNGNAALTLADFIGAWRRTVDLFRAEGVTNVAWVWNPITQEATLNGGDFPPFYPGDDYVDWAGLDMYDSEAPLALEPAYQFAVAHGKPFFLGEWGIGSGALAPPQERAWLEGMFDVFETHPKIKAVVYYNYKQQWEQETPVHMAEHVYLYDGQVNYHPNLGEGDSRLLADGGAGFRSTFAQRVANPRYLATIVSGVGATASPTLSPSVTRPPTQTATATPQPTPASRPTATSTPRPAPTSTPMVPTPTPTTPPAFGAAADVAQWLEVLEETSAITQDDEVAWDAQPGEWYRVVLVEDGWALGYADGESSDVLVWIKLDERVLFVELPAE
jgi:hypothetical protein